MDYLALVNAPTIIFPMPPANSSRKILCCVDGLNFYYGIDQARKPYLKWVNFRELIDAYCKKRNPEIELDINYYYAKLIHSKKEEDQKVRQRAFINALENYCNIEIIYGFHKQKKYHLEEKMTDVNIAIDIIAAAHREEYDELILIGADTDMIPILEYLAENFLKLGITIFSPPNRHNTALTALAKKSNRVDVKKIRTATIAKHLLPESIIVKTRKGKQRTITRPSAYNPPAPQAVGR